MFVSRQWEHLTCRPTYRLNNYHIRSSCAMVVLSQFQCQIILRVKWKRQRGVMVKCVGNFSKSGTKIKYIETVGLQSWRKDGAERERESCRELRWKSVKLGWSEEMKLWDCSSTHYFLVSVYPEAVFHNNLCLIIITISFITNSIIGSLTQNIT